MRLVPLRNTSTRPPDGDSGSEVPGGFSWRCAHWSFPRFAWECSRSRCSHCLFCTSGSALTQSVVGTIRTRMRNFQATPIAPFRRPNGIIAEGVERHGCRERRDGPGMALRGVPLERWWSEGTPPQAGPDVGGKRFWLLFPRLEKVTRPAGRNHCISQHANKLDYEHQVSSPKHAPIKQANCDTPPHHPALLTAITLTSVNTLLYPHGYPHPQL